jgi:two-component system response regulator DesR
MDEFIDGDRNARSSSIRRFMVAQLMERKIVLDARQGEAPALAMRGERIINPTLANAVLSGGLNPLTEREREVLAQSRSGVSFAEIANALFLSEGTVRNYLSDAIGKLGAHNRIEAALLAQEKGWL